MKDGTTLEELVARAKKAQRELEWELDRLLKEKRRKFQYQIRRGRIIFERQVRRLHKRQRTGLWSYIRNAPLATIASAPIIYGMIIPLAFLDLTITLYQLICFRIYDIPRVRRSDYLTIDRHYLPYLNLIEKINCVYCGYGNGLVEYAREVIGRTEKYWCPIKHARRTKDPHRHTEQFFDYGDARAWKDDLSKLRKDWQEETTSS
ncbi:MAG TPA: hypothetical protein ENK84_00445 [Desulfobulbus sp.]|nr:hypothetical protein [Desulfobulbus sp.]